MIVFSPDKLMVDANSEVLDRFRRPATPINEIGICEPIVDDLTRAPAIRAGYAHCSKCNCGSYQGDSNNYCACGHSYGDHW
jgi:hypothetical protein